MDLVAAKQSQDADHKRSVHETHHRTEDGDGDQAAKGAQSEQARCSDGVGRRTGENIAGNFDSDSGERVNSQDKFSVCTEKSQHFLLQVNLVGPFFLTHRVAKEMIKQGSGMIINITSMSIECSYVDCSVDKGI